MDRELDSLLREELRDRSLRLGSNLAALAEQLAASLERAAHGFERLAAVAAEADARRAEFRRRECPGRFDEPALSRSRRTPSGPG